MFNITGSVLLADSLFFLLFASGEEQEWNKVTGNRNNDAKDVDAAVTVSAEGKNPSENVMQKDVSLKSSGYDKYVSEGSRNLNHNKAFMPD